MTGIFNNIFSEALNLAGFVKNAVLHCKTHKSVDYFYGDGIVLTSMDCLLYNSSFYLLSLYRLLFFSFHHNCF